MDLAKWLGEEYRIAGAPAEDTQAQSPPDSRDGDPDDDPMLH